VARAYSLTRQLHAEEFLHAHLTARNVTVVEAPIRFRRIRAQVTHSSIA